MNGSLSTHVKTLLTLGVLAVLLVVGVAWGWSAVTSPFPQKAKAKVCVTTHLHPGDRLAPPRVTVSVFNASQRVGLADRTLAAFEAQGFGPGKVGNAPKGSVVRYAQIWTKTPHSPDVLLVRSRLGPKAHVITKDGPGPGVTVMVGAGFDKVLRGAPSVKVTKATTICSPPTD
jgi:hypothetical protein